MWYKHTMEYYSALKRNEVLVDATTWRNLEGVIYLFLFLAALGLHCTVGFSLVAVSQGLVFSSGAGASHRGRFSWALSTVWLPDSRAQS